MGTGTGWPGQLGAGWISCLLLALGASACDEERFTHEQLLSGCVRRNACDVMPYARLKDCAFAYAALHRPLGLAPTYAAIYRCVNEAGGDCRAIRACFGIDPAGASCDASFTARCDQQRAISCDLLSHAVYALDCAASELSCAVPQTQQFEARCTRGSCAAGEPRRCEGDRLLSCANGLWEVMDCQARGLSCAASTTGAVECVGAGEACQRANRCDGSIAIRCVGGREARLQCADHPLTSRCEEGRCVPAGQECLDELDRCRGEALESCLDGRWTQLDCNELGLGPCVASNRGARCGGR